MYSCVQLKRTCAAYDNINMLSDVGWHCSDSVGSQSSVQNVKHRRHSNYVRVLKIAILFYFTSTIVTIMHLVVIGNSRVLKIRTKSIGAYFYSARQTEVNVNVISTLNGTAVTASMPMRSVYATVHFYTLAAHYTCRYKYTNG